MADFGMKPDIALGVKGPAPISLSDLVTMARGTQLLEKEGIDLNTAKQTDIERKRVAQFMSNPDNFQTDGRVDMDKINKVLPQIAPLTGRDYMEKLTSMSTAQTQSDEAKRKLTAGGREMIASRLAILGRVGVKDPKAYEAELDLLAQQNPNDKNLHNLVKAYKSQLGLIGDPQSLPQIAIRESQSLLTPSAQETQFAPKASLQDLGGSFQPVVTTPSVGGQAPQIQMAGQPIQKTLGPNFIEVPTGKVDAFNNPTAFRYSPDGRLLGEFPIGAAAGRGPAPAQGLPTQPSVTPATPTGAAAQMNEALQLKRIPPGESAETMREMQTIRSKANEAAKGVQNQIFNSGEIIKLADAATTGKGAEILANLSGGYAAIPFSGDMATNLQQLGHYMSLQTQALSASSGLNTDAGRAIAQESAGTTNWTPEAIKSTARVNRALALSTRMYNNGIENAVKNSGGNVFAIRDFNNKWSNELDIKALKLYDSFINKDVEGLAQAVRALGGKDSKGYKDAKAKIEQLKSMAGM